MIAKTSFHALFFAERPTLPIVILPARLSMQYPAETRAAERSHRREESIGSGEAKIRSTWRAKVLKQMSVFDNPRVSLRKKMFSESSRDETNYPLYLRILILLRFCAGPTDSFGHKTSSRRPARRNTPFIRRTETFNV